MYRNFNNALLDLHPDLIGVLKPSDQYQELEQIKKNIRMNIPTGSFNSKVIVVGGEIVERVFKNPTGQIVSLFPESTNLSCDQVA